ncbi:MAG: hypothetical protein WC979_07045 [Candidatus Pacearchaeota archaeon]|jgi:hypothetical protein
MIIKSLDTIVNKIPDCSAELASQLLIESFQKRQAFEKNPDPRILDIAAARVVGYMGGVGAQAVVVGGFAGYKTNSVLIGVGIGLSGAVAPIAVKAIKYSRYIMGNPFR